MDLQHIFTLFLITRITLSMYALIIRSWLKLVRVGISFVASFLFMLGFFNLFNSLESYVIGRYHCVHEEGTALDDAHSATTSWVSNFEVCPVYI